MCKENSKSERRERGEWVVCQWKTVYRLFYVGKKTPEAAILEKKRESGVPLFCVPRQRRSSQSENVSFVFFSLNRWIVVSGWNFIHDACVTRARYHSNYIIAIRDIPVLARDNLYTNFALNTISRETKISRSELVPCFEMLIYIPQESWVNAGEYR